MDGSLLRKEDLADLLNISPRHVTRLILTGGVPAPIRFGRSVRWRKADVDRWLDARADQSATSLVVPAP